MPPTRGIPADRWREIVSDAHLFAEQRGRQALALGWSVRDVFGCSPLPGARLDFDGLVMTMRGRRVVAITADTATIQDGRDRMTYRRKGLGVGAAVLWELETSDGARG